jgi:predicted RNA-binding Zn ribbon-like protein
MAATSPTKVVTGVGRVPTLKHCMKCGSLLVDRRDEDNLPRRVCGVDSCAWIFYNNPVPVVAGTHT